MEIAWKQGAAQKELSGLLYTIEAQSEHPLAEAVVKYFNTTDAIKTTLDTF